jgi:hypothetical protein
VLLTCKAAVQAHMYILTPDSVFWYKQEHMTFWQKSLYWIPMILHFTLIWAVRFGELPLHIQLIKHSHCIQQSPMIRMCG